MSNPCEVVGVAGEQCEKLKQLLKENPCPSRAKRAPSFYNLFSRECIKAKGGIKKFGEAGPIMRQCATEYREDKAKGSYRYKVSMPNGGNPDSYQGYTKGNEAQLWKGRDLQAEWQALYRKVSGRGKKK